MTATLIATPRQLSDQFDVLKKQWIKETEHLSSPSEIALHPSYQRIIGLGPQVIPLLLQELAKSPNQWFWALKAITGEDPVPIEHRGRIHAMAKAWLAWGAENGWSAE